MPNPSTIYIIAGETSGDLLGAKLAESLKALNPSISLRGMGGERMAEAGVALDLDFTKFAVIGFIEVLKHYQDFKRIFEETVARLQKDPPAAVVLVDYPGFNLRLAQRLKEIRLPSKIIFYVSPQVWAWKAGRVELIRKYVDRLLVLFEFEKDFYKRCGIDVDFVGHPLIEHVRSMRYRYDVREDLRLPECYPVIGLMPGSRKEEVRRHLPVMLEAYRSIRRKKNAQVKALVIQAPDIPLSFLSSIIKDDSVRICGTNTYDAIAACDLCFTASGTATLETALLGTPMVVIYKTSWPTYIIAKAVVKIPYISLVNIVAGRKVVPELIQHHASPRNLMKAAWELLDDKAGRVRMKENLEDVRKKLGAAGASERAAQAVLNEISHP